MNQQHTVIALNADIVSYSRLLADDHHSTAAAVDAYQQLVSDTVSDNNGTLINFVGDNFMAIFTDVSEAIKAAMSITAEIEHLDLRTASSEKVRFRMGLDFGPVTESEKQFYGDALNIAARIQAIAKPGGICVSGKVYEMLDEPALRFRSIGKQRLKNIPESLAVYEFLGFPSDDQIKTDRTLLALEAPTVAVLPIHIKNGDELLVEAADVLRQELVHRLASVPQLKVVNVKSEISEERDLSAARYMIETGVHKHGNTVRVFATLFDVTTMNIVKSYKWFVNANELFELSETLASDVARSIEVELIVGEPAGLYSELNDPVAIEKVYLGWYHLRADTQEGWNRALDLFTQVITSHAHLPYGYVLSAFANWVGAANNWVTDVEKTLSIARNQSAKARESGDPTGMAQAIEGAILMSQGRHEEALAAIEQLEITRPTCDVTYGLEGSVRRYLGQWEKAVDLLDRAMRLTGVNKPWYPTVKACSLFIGEQVSEAMAVAEMVLEYQPNNLEALAVLAAAQYELGMDRRAKATIHSIRNTFPSVDIVDWLNRNPYKNVDRIERWKKDLSLIDAA